MTVKTDYSRFDIHDELSAPEGSAKLLGAIAGSGGEVPKLIGVLAGSPSVLRGFARLRHELSGGVLAQETKVRIALAVAERSGDVYSIGEHARVARSIGLGLDEISRARSFDSGDPREAALLAFMQALLDADGRPPKHLQEEAREAGWSDEQLLEAIAIVALSEFQSLVANAAELPQEKTAPQVLPEAA